MSKAGPDSDPSCVAEGLGIAAVEVGALVRALASDSATPGSGAAGAVALALAAGCAGKAAAVSLKHRPESDRLRAVHAQLAALSERALACAEADARRFEAFLHAPGAATVGPLLHVGEALAQLAATLEDLVDELAPDVDPMLAGDLLAARALCAASLAISRENSNENRRAARPAALHRSALHRTALPRGRP